MSSSVRWFQLSPVDAWFFRNGRPFNRGENSGAGETLFPPTSSTVIGALRATLARQLGWTGKGPWKQEQIEVLGDRQDLGGLQFLGPFPTRRSSDEVQPWFRVPNHILGTSKRSTIDGAPFEPGAWLKPSATTPISERFRFRPARSPWRQRAS